MKIKRMIPALFVAGLLLGVSVYCTYSSVGLQQYEINEENMEWLPGKTALGPLSPEKFFNYDCDIMLLGGKDQSRNEVVINDFAVPEDDKESFFDLSAEDDKYLSALALMKDGKLAEAEVILLDYLQVLPRHADAWRQLGDCQYNLGKVHDAIWAYENSLKYDQNNFLALRGLGVVTLYIGYESFDYKQYKKSHSYFQKSLASFHECLEFRKNDSLSAYGQSLAAEGVSRELYRIAKTAVNTENHDQAKSIIRNCLDIIDSAIAATHDRIGRRADDDEAKMLLSSLLVRRAKVLQPFGHIEEASDNLDEAMAIIEPLAQGVNPHKNEALNQIALCNSLKKSWNKQ